jgi:protein involved in polysaccharide export with SLBB domain
MARRRLIGSCARSLCITSFLTLAGPAAAQPSFEAPRSADDSSGGGQIEIPVEDIQEEALNAGRRGGTMEPDDLPLEEPLDPASYVCGSGDSFELRFWGKQNLSIRVTADMEGYTFIPKVGKVRVAGKTLSVAREQVLRAVRRYYPGLNTDLSLLKPRVFLVHLAGDIKRPGAYRANPRLRLSAVIAKAGGPIGSMRRIQIRHRDHSTDTGDLLLYARTGDTRYNPYLLDGDVVHVPKPGMEAAIQGPVQNPGRYELVGTRDLAELMELSGGLRSSASRLLPITITRRDRNERRTTIKLRFGADGRPPRVALRDDDEVQIPGTGEMERSVILVGAVVGADPADPATTIKRMGFIEGDTVRSLLERAGGVTVAADLQGAYIRRDGERMQRLDLEALLVRRDFRKDRRVRIGDTIVVPFKRRSVLVEGAVVRAGSFQFNPHFGVREYLASAGGTTRYAQDDEDIRLIGTDGKMRSFSEDLKVIPGDTIVVPERNFSRAEVVQLVMGGVGLIVSGVALTYAVSR